MAKTFTVQDFFRRFPDDDACLEHLMEVRYGNPTTCAKCGKEGRFARLRNLPAYSCPSCGDHIHPMAGTPFNRTRTPLQKWFYAMYLFTTTRHGVPAKELQRQLGVTYKTAWRIGHEIRKYLGATDGDGGLSGQVEVDETYMGGRKPGATGRTHGAKTVVFGMVERNGEAILRVVDDARKATLEPHILQHIAPGSTINSDEWISYRGLSRHGYTHQTVNHRQEEWVRGDAHTNGIESLWSQLKRSIKGTHIHVSKKHLPKYLAEFEYRFNMRHDPQEMFDRLLMAF